VVTTSGKLKGVQDKKDLLMAVRRLNPAGCNPAPIIFWDVEGNLKNVNIDSSGVAQQVTIVEGGVNLSVKKFNDLKTLCDQKTRILKQRLDDMEAVRREAEALETMFLAEDEEGKRIEQLKAEALQVEESIYKKTHKTRVLEHMLLRLNRNQLKFDAHLNGMQETLKTIEKEGVDVRHLRRDLDAGLAKAVAVLEETQVFLAGARKDRECLIEQRRGEVKTAQNLQAWLKKRDQSKIDLAIALRGDLSKEEQTFLKKELREKEERTRKLQSQNAENLKRVHELEEAFIEIKQVTGAQDVKSMVAKFMDQKTNRKNLEKEVKDAERKLNGLKRDYANIEKTFQDLKTSNAGRAEYGREYVLSMENDINAAKMELKLLAATTDRTSNVMMGIRQGAKGLLQRAQPYSFLLREPGAFDLTLGVSQSTADEAVWVETLDALTNAEQVYSKMIEINAAVGELPTKAIDDDEKSLGSIQSLETAAEAPLYSLNVRIKSIKTRRDEELKLMRGDDLPGTTGNALGGTVMQMLAMGAADNPVRSFHEDDDFEDGTILVKGTMTNSDKMDMTRRGVVKQLSVNTVQDAHRQKELQDRKVKLAESLKARNAAADALADVEGAIANAARYDALFRVSFL